MPDLPELVTDGTGNPRYIVDEKGDPYSPQMYEHLDAVLRSITDWDGLRVVLLTPDLKTYPVILECTDEDPDDPDGGLHWEVLLAENRELVERVEYADDDPNNFDAATRTICVHGFA